MNRLVRVLALCSVGALGLLAQPVNVSVSPSSGSGTNQTFAFTASSSAGYQNLAWIQVIFNYAVESAGACYLLVYPNGTVSVSSDTGYTYGSGWAASGVLGTSGYIANSQCSLNLGASSLSGAGNNLTATLNLTFGAGLPGPQQVYMMSGDNSGLASNWQQMGTWTTSAVSSQPPSPISVTPAAGTGMTQTFSYTASSVNGSSYLATMQLLLNTGVNASGACFVVYGRAPNLIYLMNDNNTAWLSAPLRRPGTLTNSQCTVDAGASAAVASGNTLTLDLVVTFNGAWAGPKNTYAFAEDRGDNTAGWTQMGSWTVGSPAITTDARRTGIYSTGSYWGGGGEQIDTLSGNLNFSLPLLTAQGRTGWTVPLGLTYNSQNWRQDNGANLELGGGDVGYGFGWQMQIGSITPYTAVTQSSTAIDHYVYTDGTGAQYQLNYNSNGVWWSSTQSVYVWFDAAANRLHFRDGSFWVMGCTSSSGEADADAMYPTTVEDVNGNQVLIVYGAGAGIPVSANNTSARIASITDVRAPSAGVTYNFGYNSDSPVPHLMWITNYIQTAESFNFTYAGAAMGPPFGADAGWTGKTTSHLATMNVPSTGNYQFTYDSAGAGELGQVTFPYGGHLRWVYQNFQYAGGRTLREVSARYLAADPAGMAEWGAYTITHPDSANSVAVHSSTTLTDASGIGAKTWNFLGGASSAWAVGLISDFAQKASAGSTNGITHDYYTWSQNAGGHPYISAKTSRMDEGTGNQQSALTTQTQDGYGNTTQSVVYPFNNTSTPVKTYNNTYLYTTGYAPEYIFNRLLTTTLTTGGAVKTLVNNYYDGKVAAGQAAYPTTPTACSQYSGNNWSGVYSGGTGFPGNLLDPQALPFASRGQLSASVTPSVTTCGALYPWGSPNITAASDGSTTSSTLTSATNYAAPSTFTTQSYGQNLAYNAWLGVTSTTGLNGEQLSIAYDTYGRPSTATSPYGGVTYYGYSTSLPFQQTKTGPDGFTRTTLDGLGRTIRVERGFSASNIQSLVDTNYAPCACSPLGKIQKVSAPYPAGQSPSNWTVYSYDGIGRTVSTVQPDGSSTTSYAYAGNLTTVTDPAGKWKQYTNDALGNLVTVVEPDPANQPGGTLTTSYSYDWMNHVSGVSMPRAGATQTRSFVYSDAGLLTSATNPESGTVTYTYNADNTLQDKHDAKGQDTVYTYDSQKRVTMLQRYPNGRSNAEDTCQRVTYTYDTNPLNGGFSQNSTGRLTTAQYAGCVSGHAFSAADMYSYHAAGAVTAKQLRVVKCDYDRDGNYECPAAPLEVDYTYDGMGQVSSVVYPGGQQAVYGSDGMGRHISLGYPQAVSCQYPNGGNNNVIQNGQYDFAGRMTSLQYQYVNGDYGTTCEFGFEIDYSYVYQTESRTYNAGTGRLTSIAWSPVSAIGYSFGGGSVQYVYPATQNNGQITQMVDSLSGETVTYQYDALKRLVSACSSLNNCGTAPTTFQYDGFGNLTSKTLAGVTSSIPVNAGTNQLTNAFYDANGNMTSGAGVTLTYDVGNRVRSASPASGGTEYYGYSTDNKRMWRLKADGVTEEWTLYGKSGERIGVYQWAGLTEHFDSQGNWTGDTAGFTALRTSLWFDGRLVAENGSYVMGDRLGTNRAGGARFLPYGEETSSTANDRVKFGTYNRDGFTGLDYADQRYYASTYGRFGSPDPYGGSAGPRVPLSWNRYMYVLGDPVNGNDPTGKTSCIAGDDDNWVDDGDGYGCEYEGKSIYDTGGSGDVIGTTTGTGCLIANEEYYPDNGNCDMPVWGFNAQGGAIAQAIGQNGNAMNTAIATFAGASVVAGTVIAAPAILAPNTLYHFTTTAGYQGITAAGQITPGIGLTGVGVYGTALNSAATVSWAGISTQAVVAFSPGMSAIIPAIPLPGLWWVVVPTVTTIFNSGVPTGLGR